MRLDRAVLVPSPVTVCPPVRCLASSTCTVLFTMSMFSAFNPHISERLNPQNNASSNVNRYLVDGIKGFISRMLFKAERLFAFDRDRVSAAIAVKRISKKGDLKFSVDTIGNEAFDLMVSQAEEESLKASDNPFDISDKSWNRKFSKTYEADKNAHPDRICPDSPEFEDLTAFLEVCRQTGLQAKLIIMPVNGKWFDYIGTGKQQRRETTDRILKLAEEYGAEAADLTVYEYEPFITKDVTHPWNKGWALIDREIYNFCTEKGSK